MAPGERVQCSSDVTVQCQSAAIAGELYSANGRQAGGDAPDIAIEATGDIVLTGRIVTGGGAGGAEQGGDGGSIRLTSSGGSLTIGSAGGARDRAVQPVLQSGDGGSGADGLLGGAGGDGGVIHLEAPNGVLTIHQRPGLIQVGNGGHGGRGVVGGDDLLTFTPPAKLPNGGGNSGGVIATWSTVVGAEVVENAAATPSQRLLLGAGAITGGRGGDAGDCYVGVDPDTGGSTWPARSGSRVGREDKYVEVVGSDGGEGATQGGAGSSVDVSYSGEPVSTGVRGTSVEARGGEGGEGNWRNGVGSDGQDLHGGNGGAAKAVGGTGGPGDGCGAQGTAGGKATARAGQGWVKVGAIGSNSSSS
ncbi:MAG: hypothetical protein HYU66_22480 [Armatimonadetes bacterium]|nr:hypothetical protein [Armatimonadota bacterium]